MIVDAYAGVGTISMWLAPLAQRVWAIEENPAAVADGRRNLELNQIDNVEFICDTVESALPKLSKDRHATPQTANTEVADKESIDIFVVDPPRKGLSGTALSAILEFAARRIIYVSCNPVTLARDLKILEGAGYKTIKVQPVDLFPQTFHVECVAVLDKS